jgi:hypothetical protein
MDYSKHTNLQHWLDQMASLPHHDAVHASIAELGPLPALLLLDSKQLGAKLGAATKAGASGIRRAEKENERTVPV